MTAASSTRFGDFSFAAAIPADPVARLEAFSRFLDGAMRVPGTNIRIGADALIGLIPGVGNLVTTAMSTYLIWEACNLGLPGSALARMIANVALDSAFGAVPFAGNVADVFWRANLRNMAIVRAHLARSGKVIDGEFIRVD